MNLGLESIYDEMVNTSSNKHIGAHNFHTKPTMVSGIFTPESTIEVSPYGDLFKIDEEGMHKVLGMLEEKMTDEEAKRNLLALLTKVYEVADEYLGGRRNII